MRAFLPFDYSRYEYKGIIFYGKKIGEESWNDQALHRWEFYNSEGKIIDKGQEYVY